MHSKGTLERSQATKKFVKAARLVVAFRPPKAKHTVDKGEGEQKAGPAFVLRAEPADADHHPPAQLQHRGSHHQPHAHGHHAHGQQPHGHAGSHSQPGSHPNSHPNSQREVAGAPIADDAHSAATDELLSDRSLEKKHSMISIMTDSVDDSPQQSRAVSPKNLPGVVITTDHDHMGTGRGAGPSGVTPHHKELKRTPTATAHSASKPALFDFQPPEESTKPSRKGVNSFINKLKERVGSSKAQALDQIVQQEEEDDDSVVTSYFDHNAAPIFVEREKAEKHVLHSKRFDKPEQKEYKSRRRDDDDDGIEEWEEDITSIIGGGGGGEGSVKPLTPAGVKPVKPNFDLSKFMSNLSEEERIMMSSLPLEAVNKIMESMNVSVLFLPVVLLLFPVWSCFL